MTPIAPISLADWRRRIAALYVHVRAEPDPVEGWGVWRNGRDDLFAHHPQTPLDADQRSRFTGLRYFAYDLDLRVDGCLNHDIVRKTFELKLPTDGIFRFSRVAEVSFKLAGHAMALNLYWVEGYGGGLFLPFRDGTNRSETYGGGRYLYDGIKGADLSLGGDELLLDFNFAYNPSCAYNDQWVCPLAVPENWLGVPIRAGEKKF